MAKKVLAPQASKRKSVTACKLSAAQKQTLEAMQNHKLVWRAWDNKCYLLSGESPIQGVLRVTVQKLLDGGYIEGPMAMPKKDAGLYDALYKLTSAGKKAVR